MDARRGIFWAVVSVFFFSLMAALVKWLSSSYSATQIAFCRSLFALLPVLPLFLAQSRTASLRPRAPLGHVARGVIGVAGMVLIFYGVGRLPLAVSTAIAFTIPLWVTALARPVLGERVDVQAWAAVIVGFAGVLVIVPPTGGAQLVPALLLVLGNGLIGFSVVLVRRLGRTEATPSIVFYYTLALIVGTGALAPIDWRTPPWPDVPLLIAVGIVGGTAHLVMTHAYRLAPAVVVAPFDYTGLLWGVVFGILVWHEWPGPNLFAGSTLVVGSGLYILWRETRASKRVPSPAPGG
jgi:drug/metabolite transporter (DMT)-like permease